MEVYNDIKCIQVQDRYCCSKHLSNMFNVEKLFLSWNQTRPRADESSFTDLNLFLFSWQFEQRFIFLFDKQMMSTLATLSSFDRRADDRRLTFIS